ncbi:MAG: DUF268 domain-containing protein [Saprospiraceae bacterium]
MIEGFRGLPLYLKDYAAFKKQMRNNKVFTKFNFHPIFGNRFQQGGIVSGHYFHQDLYMATKIYHAKPVHHLDIGSRTDGFIAHLAVFREVEVMDIRPISNGVSNVNFIQADLTSDSFPLINYTYSISCLHAIEHFGLGRYGDNINANGYLIGLENIYKCLKKDGIFYFSTPIGVSRIEFNAHRVFSMKYLLDLFKDKYRIISFSYVDDRGNLLSDAILTEENIESNFGCNYGCGLFELKKIG